MKVKLNDVIDRITGNVDRYNTELEYYVGGEHYECGRLAMYDKGLLDSEKGSTLGFKFHFPFQATDVLFMARNPHLKKAAMVMFDGICSDASYILRTKDESILQQRYIPLIIQNDNFWAFFEANKSGSVNYLMNWKEMKEYEFDLPDIKKQEELVELVWGIEETIAAYERLLAKTDELVKSQFIEMFGEDGEKGKCITKTLQELIDMKWITYHLDGNHGGDYPRADEFVDAGIPYISANCIVGDRIDMTLAKFVTAERAKRFRKGIAANGDVLFAHNATVGPVAILETEEPTVILGTSLTSYRCNSNYILAEYLMAYMKNPLFIQQYERNMQQSTRKQVPITTQRKYTFIIPSMDEQKEFANFVKQSDKSKFIVQIAIYRDVW